MKISVTASSLFACILYLNFHCGMYSWKISIPTHKRCPREIVSIWKSKSCNILKLCSEILLCGVIASACIPQAAIAAVGEGDLPAGPMAFSKLQMYQVSSSNKHTRQTASLQWLNAASPEYIF